MNYIKSLDDGLYLEHLNKLISWKTNQEELLNKLQNYQFSTIENSICNYCGISINSRFLDSEEQATITFNFVKSVLKSVNVSFPFFEKDVVQSFESTQHFLEDKLGSPMSFNLFNSKRKKFRWKLKKVIITHEMFESFSLRETLEITII